MRIHLFKAWNKYGTPRRQKLVTAPPVILDFEAGDVELWHFEVHNIILVCQLVNSPDMRSTMGFLPVVKEGAKGCPSLKVDFQTVPIAIPIAILHYILPYIWHYSLPYILHFCSSLLIIFSLIIHFNHFFTTFQRRVGGHDHDNIQLNRLGDS